MKGFVAFSPLEFGWGLSMAESDLSSRILVGAKGSGKTVFLRRMHARASLEQSVYADDVQYDPPRPETIVRFCNMYSERDHVERWATAWKCALLRTICCHVCNTRLRDQVTSAALKELTSFPSHIVPRRKAPVSAYVELESLLAHHAAPALLSGAAFSELEAILARSVGRLPAMYFFLDALDEWWEQAPKEMLSCQLGLLRTALDLLQDRRMGGRVHVCVAFRNEVWSAISESEHFDRISDDPHVRNLNWDHSAIEWFLAKKIDQLPNELLLSPESDTPIQRWLGRATIRNERGTVQKLTDYLIDHTRLLPRDIVRLGNVLCERIMAIESQQQRQLQPAAIRSCVESVAHELGVGQLRICATELAARYAPLQSHTSLDGSGLVQANMDVLQALLGSLEASQFKWTQAGRMFAEGTAAGLPDGLDSIMWRHGIIGYRGRRRNRAANVFYGSGAEGASLPEIEKSTYLIHPNVAAYLGLPDQPRKTKQLKPQVATTSHDRTDRGRALAAPPSVVLLYAHEDTEIKQRLAQQLQVFANHDRFDVWSDNALRPGADWERGITAAIDQATVVVLVITAAFLTSEFITGTELPRAKAAAERRGLTVLPLIVKECGWQADPWIASLQAIPGTGKALWHDRPPSDADLTMACREVAQSVLVAPGNDPDQARSQQS